MRREKYISVILANLTAKEYARVQAARVTYSGATGPDAKPEEYGGAGPYIATSYAELRPALRALRWKRFSVAINAGQWVARKERARRRAA